MTPKEILQEWNNCNRLAAKEGDPIPFATRSGMQVAINQAKDRKKVLQQEYKKHIFQDSVAIFIDGDKEAVNTFAGVTQHAFGNDVIVVDGNSLYTRVADSIRFVVDNGIEIGSSQLFAIFNAFKAACDEAYYLTDLEAPSPQSIKIILDFDELVEYTRRLIQDRNGILPNVAYVKHIIAMNAFIAEFEGSTLPVILYNVSDTEKQELRKVFTANGTANLTLTQETKITPEFVSSQIRNAKKARTEAEEIDIEITEE